MKKYLKFPLMLAAAATLSLGMQSCDPDPDNVKELATITVDPSSVIRDFAEYELESGKLEALPVGAVLRISLFIYDSDGNKAYESTKDVANYTQTFKDEMFLEPGDYTSVVVVDTYKPSSNVYYYTLSGFDRLSTATISREGYVGFEGMLLGIAVNDFTVYADENPNIRILPKPHVAMFVILYSNIHAIPAADKIGLLANRSGDKVEFNANGDLTTSVKSNGNKFSWWNQCIMPSRIDESYELTHQFIFPMDNYSIYFTGLDKNENMLFYGQTITLNVKVGDVYYGSLDLDDEGDVTYIFGQVVEGSRSPVQMSANNGDVENILYIRDIQKQPAEIVK